MVKPGISASCINAATKVSSRCGGNIKTKHGKVAGQGHGQGQAHIAETDNGNSRAAGEQIVKMRHEVFFV